MSRFNDGEPCTRCSKPAAGVADINGQRYCHGDHERPTCYMQEQLDRAWISFYETDEPFKDILAAFDEGRP